MKKANPQNIWAELKSDRHLPPKLTEEAVTSFEAEVGLKLPETLLDLLKVQNGGYLDFEHPEFKLLHTRIHGIDPESFHGSLFRLDQEDNDGMTSFPINDLIAFDGDGHWYLCLDYRQNQSSPAVTYIDLEGDEQMPIAESFSAYLEQLMFKTEDMYVIEPDWDIERVMTLLEKRLFTFFGPLYQQGDWPQTRSARVSSGYGESPDQILLGPNLKTELSGSPGLSQMHRIRHPFLPASSYLMEITDQGSDRSSSLVLTILKEAGLEPRHLREYF